ncbi:hypothetical protein DXK91_14610 [Parageobacillus toebii]|nr:hypothetical protein CN643_07935 [Parageobacillus yumthangensis]PUF85570.1 hypothetical protein DCC82_17005 [Geobacillus sp. LYN3]RDV21366.1 hypothetical protein DXK91_14610 [Parageobacillus toebii]
MIRMKMIIEKKLFLFWKELLFLLRKIISTAVDIRLVRRNQYHKKTPVIQAGSTCPILLFIHC